MLHYQALIIFIREISCSYPLASSDACIGDVIFVADANPSVGAVIVGEVKVLFVRV